MGIHVYNTLTRQLEPFVTRDDKKASMYVCGVTPYDTPHLGNARPAVVFDIIRRYLEYSGYLVTYVTNFTDVDDKIIARSQKEGVPWHEWAQRCIDIYFDEMDALNVKRASVYPRATEHIDDIISLVEALIQRGHAYMVEGDVYFAVRTFDRYGMLSNRKLDDMEAGARVDVSDLKRDPMDFALWKSAKPGEPSWESPWGAGRPGWHIECSAMALKLLGAGFDIHGGGHDLVFPHHENEIAQSEAALDADQMFARYWLHNGFVTINKEKMSKSLGNFFTIREILAKYPAEVVRYFLTATHYRSPIDFSDQTLDQARSAFERLRQGVFSMKRVLESGQESPMPYPAQSAALLERLSTAEDDFRMAMDEDFNTPRALAVLFDLVSESNRLIGLPDFEPNVTALKALSDTRVLVLRLTDVLGLQLLAEAGPSDSLAPPLMELLIELRATLRKEKNYALADTIRTRLTEIGIVLEDTPQGTVWRQG